MHLEHLERDLNKKLREAKLAHRHQLEETVRERNPKRLWDNMKKMAGLELL